MNITFKKIKNDDYQEIFAMILSLYADDTDGEEMNLQKITKTFDFFAQNPNNGEIFVFRNADTIIGYAILVFFWSNEFGGTKIYLDELFVAESYRSHGVGRAFIEFLFADNFRDIVGCELEVLPHNKRAVRFYESLGFVKSERSYFWKPAKS